MPVQIQRMLYFGCGTLTSNLPIAATLIGVCHSDLHIKEGGWGAVQFPRVGGHEGIGHVVAIGEHTVDSPVKIGDRVGIKWTAKACLRYATSL